MSKVRRSMTLSDDFPFLFLSTNTAHGGVAEPHNQRRCGGGIGWR
ncbi:hypothetical protein Hanom_Chr11g01016851 [Helianthus anomalus]